MAKLTTVTAGSSPQEPLSDSDTASSAPPINIEELANTSSTTTQEPASAQPTVTDEAPLLDDALLISSDDTSPKRTTPLKDITKNPVANTLAIALLTFGLIGGVSLIWWGISAAQNSASATDETDLEAVIEDEKQKEIDALNQQLYEQRANVALKDLKVEPEEETDIEETDTEADTDTPNAVAATPTPRPTTAATPRSSSPPPPPRRVTPTPVNNRAGTTTTSNTNAQPSFDSPNLWHDLAALGQITSTEFNGDMLPPPPLVASAEMESLNDIEPVNPTPQTGWNAADIPLVMVSRTNSNSWPSHQGGPHLRDGEISQGELGILNQQSVTQPQAQPQEPSIEAPEPDKPDETSDENQIVASAKPDDIVDPWKGLTEDTWEDENNDDTIVYNADDYWDAEESDPPPDTTEANDIESDIIYASNNTTDAWDVEVDPSEGWDDLDPSSSVDASDTTEAQSTWEVEVDPSDGWDDGWSPEDEQVAIANTDIVEQDTIATVAIGSITNAEVITPIVWDQEAPRPTDGIFTIELTEPMLGINNEVVLPEGTRLVANVSYVSEVGHVYQTVTAIYLPSGEQMPVPVIGHEEGTNAPITPLVVRGKKGAALIADAVERSDGGRNSLGNDLLIGAVNGLAEAVDNALEPSTNVQVNQGFGSSTVESQENVNDPTAAFARGFLESTAYRMEERLYEDTEEIQVFQVDSGKKVSVVVNGLMSFSIPAEGWPE